MPVMMGNSPPLAQPSMLTLHSFVISHFSEKIRWTLRACGVPFVERALTPGLHMAITPFIGRRGSSVPIVTGDGLRVQGSDRILHRLATRGLIDSLLPDEDEARDAALLAAASHDGLGRAVMMAAYAPMLNDPREVFRVWTLAAHPAEIAVLKAVMPMMFPAFRRRFGLADDGIARARARIEATLDAIASRRGNRPYLGAAFGIEDLTVCALLAPLAGPDAHPLYGHAVFRDSIAAAVAPWAQHPTMRWVQEVYARNRGVEPADSVLLQAAGRL